MSLTLSGRKRGMTRIFDKTSGKSFPCTVIEVEPNIISQIKTKEKDGYVAVQLASGGMTPQEKKRMKKPEAGHFSKKGLEPKKVLHETRLLDASEWEVGKEVDVTQFEEGTYVDVRGTSKGKGYQGVIKRHGVARIVSSHGAGPVVRHIGSSGFLTSHGRVHKNKKAAGHMGSERVTVEGLQVLKVDKEKNALVVKGAIPGANGGVVFIRKAMKRG